MLIYNIHVYYVYYNMAVQVASLQVNQQKHNDYISILLHNKYYSHSTTHSAITALSVTLNTEVEYALGETRRIRRMENLIS